MVHRNTKIIALISAGLFLATIAVFLGFFYIVEQHKEALHEQRIEFAKERMRQDNLASLVRTVDNSKEERASLESRILAEEQIIDLLTLIETVGEEQGTKIVTSSLTTNPVNATFEELKINLSAKGNYESIIKTLALLEYLPYQSRVSDVLITNGTDEKSLEWSASFEVIVTKFIKL